MALYCTQCKNNWVSLWTDCENEGDECVEYCPVCKTDSYITETEDYTNLVWKPLGEPPTPVGYPSFTAWQRSLYLIWLKENKLTEEEHMEQIRLKTISWEQEYYRTRKAKMIANELEKLEAENKFLLKHNIS